jgi:hypothetical protein
MTWVSCTLSLDSILVELDPIELNEIDYMALLKEFCLIK